MNKKAIPPISKSHMQRILAASLMASETSEIKNPGVSEDDLAAVTIIESLGAKTQWSKPIGNSPDLEQVLRVTGSPELKAGTLNAGESGLSSRMFSVVVSQSPKTVEITGRGTLLNRSFEPLSEIFHQGGVQWSSNHNKLPMEITGPLRAGDYAVDGSFSSQFISGLLMTLPVLEGTINQISTVRIHNPKSRGYLDMTLEVMRKFGIQVEARKDLTEISIPTAQKYTAQNIIPEADWSGGAFLLIAQYLGIFESVVGLRRDSIQPDAQVLEMLERHGLEVHEVHNPSGPTEMRMSGTLKGPLCLDLTQTPDLFPPLVLLALFSKGEHRFSGVHRLRGKESDRAYVMANELAKAGAALSVEEDELVVLGMPNWRDALLDSHGDHRMAMLFGLINSLVDPTITTENPECVAKSFPHFWELL